MERFKSIIKWLFVTNFGRLIVAAFLMVFGWGMTNFVDGTWYDIFNVIGWIGAGYLAGFTILSMIFAYIINPIRNRKK